MALVDTSSREITWKIGIYCIILEELQRITIVEIRKDEWFLKDYTPVQLIVYENVNLDAVSAAFDDPEVSSAKEHAIDCVWAKIRRGVGIAYDGGTVAKSGEDGIAI
ncbi:unnamed protein product [Arabidopsis halleri]